MEFSRPEYWRGEPFPSPGDLPNPGIEPRSPTLQADPLPAESQTPVLMWKFSLNCQAASLWVFNLYDIWNMTDIMSYSFIRILLCRRQDRKNLKQKELHQERKRGKKNPCFSSPPKVKLLVAQSCPTLYDSMDCSPLGSSDHGALEARILQWVAMSSRGSSRPRDQSPSPAFQVDSLLSEPPGKLHPQCPK